MLKWLAEFMNAFAGALAKVLPLSPFQQYIESFKNLPMACGIHERVCGGASKGAPPLAVPAVYRKFQESPIPGVSELVHPGGNMYQDRRGVALCNRALLPLFHRYALVQDDRGLRGCWYDLSVQWDTRKWKVPPCGTGD
nr:MAG TPA: hypothetical protein [Inoviridae sp.]